MNEFSSIGNLPNLIVIGAMKCGTTSLHSYLNIHPEISMSRQKELNFFIETKNWHKGIEWYKSNFTGEAKIYGESSPNYTKRHIWKNIPEKIYSVIPKTKLIYVVRDPIERIISHYIHTYSEGTEDNSIEEALNKIEGNNYVESSKYFFQIEPYLEFFSNSSILVISSEKLLNHPQETMKKVFQFLEVDTDFKLEIKTVTEALTVGFPLNMFKSQFNTKKHQSFGKRRMKLSTDNLIVKNISTITKRLPGKVRSYTEQIVYQPFSEKIKRPKISNELRQEILDYLTEDIIKLKKMTGYSFEEWNIE